jgi:TPR repeat protein
MKKSLIIALLVLSFSPLFGQSFVAKDVKVGDSTFKLPVPARYVAIEKDTEWAKAFFKSKENLLADARRNNTYIIAMQTPERFAASKKNGEVTGLLECWAVYPNFSAESKISLQQFATLVAQAESAFAKLEQTARMDEFLGIKPGDITDEQVRRQFATMTKPTIVGKNGRSLLTVAKNGDAYLVQAWALAHGKLMFLYLNKDQNQLAEGISEMHAWLKEIEDKTPAISDAQPGPARKSHADETGEFKTIKMEAEKGDPFAQYNLGVAYANGEGVAQDNAEAVKWFRKAAEKDITEAQFNLGICHVNGWGVPKDDTEAAKWFRKAADKGDAEAQFRLGNMYDNGMGVTMDDVEAVKLYRSAAMQGHAMAQHDLGIMHARGEGVPKKDSIEAYAWFILAASSTNEPEASQEAIALRKTRDIFEKVLTLESKSQAQARAAILRKSIEENKKVPAR